MNLAVFTTLIWLGLHYNFVMKSNYMILSEVVVRYIVFLLWILSVKGASNWLLLHLNRHNLNFNHTLLIFLRKYIRKKLTNSITSNKTSDWWFSISFFENFFFSYFDRWLKHHNVRSASIFSVHYLFYCFFFIFLFDTLKAQRKKLKVL